MKVNKLLPLIGVIAAMALVGCNPAKPASEESKPVSQQSQEESQQSQESKQSEESQQSQESQQSEESKQSQESQQSQQSQQSEEPPAEPKLEFKAVDIAAENNKAFVIFTFSFEGYSEGQLKALTPYFDGQMNPRAFSKGTSWDGSWTRYTNVAEDSGLRKADAYAENLVPLEIVVSGSDVNFKLDVTNLPKYAYTLHFDALNSTIGAIGTDNYADFKPSEAMALKEVEIGDNVYGLQCDPTDTDGKLFWGCLGLWVSQKQDVTKNASIVGQDLVVEDDKLILIMKGSYEGYSRSEVEAFTVAADLQDNASHPAHTTGNWGKNNIPAEKMSIVIVDDTHFNVKIDISDFKENAWIVHFGLNTAAADCKTQEATDKIVSFGGLEYRLVSIPGNADANGFWGCQGIICRDASIPSFQFVGGHALLDGNKVYFVVEGSSENYTKETLEALDPFFDVEVNNGSAAHVGSASGKTDLSDKAEVIFGENGAFEIRIDITDLPKDGYYTHTKLGGKGNADSGDVKPGIEIDSRVQLNGVEYKVLCVPTGNNGATFWSNLALEIYDEPLPSNGIALKVGEEVKFEAELAKDTNWKASGWSTFVADDADANASGGAFITSSTGDQSKAGYFEIVIDAPVDGKVTMKVAYCRGGKNTKTPTIDYSYVYQYRLDGAGSQFTCKTENHTDNKVASWDWVEIEFEFNVTAGRHTIKGFLDSNNSTTNAGCPCVDYFKFSLQAAA